MSRKSTILTALFSIFTVSITAFGVKVLEIQPLMSGKSLNLRYSLKNGYGVQKKADNHLIVYQLRAGHQNESSVRLKIKKYGTEIGRLEAFSGKTSSRDKDYFDALNPGVVPLKTRPSGAIAIGGRIYYCSFADKFCSVQSISQIVNP